MAHLLEEIELADRVGLASYGIREHHRVEYYDAAPAVILAAAAARTSRSNAAVRQRALRRAGHPGVAGRGGSFMAVLTPSAVPSRSGCRTHGAVVVGTLALPA